MSLNLNNLGKWKISILETGFFWLDGGAMMGSVPKTLWSKTNPCDDLNRIRLAMRCLLLDDGKNVVLIESGIGDKNSEKFINMFNITQSNNALSDTLSKFGYMPENITDVILTHMHFDHSGGATNHDARGDVKPTFPNATYYISEKNWQAALAPNYKDKASYLKENFIPLKDAGVLKIVSENSEILKGISTYEVNGHTSGQQLIKVSDRNETIVFCSDLIPLKSHLKIPWIMGYDLNASLTLVEKEKFLNLASKNNWILYLYHDPEVVAVKINKNKKYFEVIDEYRRK